MIFEKAYTEPPPQLVLERSNHIIIFNITKNIFELAKTGTVRLYYI